MLNSVLNSEFCRYPSNTRQTEEQFKWLEQEIESSDLEIVIVFHIAPVVSFFEVEFGQMWKTEDVERLRTILKDDLKTKVIGFLVGHEHINFLNLFRAGDQEYPIIVAPSFAPNYNNPGFLRVKIGEFSFSNILCDFYSIESSSNRSVHLDYLG